MLVDDFFVTSYAPLGVFVDASTLWYNENCLPLLLDINFFANFTSTATHFSTSPVSTQGNHINPYHINAMKEKYQNPI